MFLSMANAGSNQDNRMLSPDDMSRSSSSRCCCHGSSRLLSSAVTDGHCDSGLSSTLGDAATATRIAEMEAELAQLRQQLALIVLAQERASSDSGRLTD